MIVPDSENFPRARAARIFFQVWCRRVEKVQEGRGGEGGLRKCRRLEEVQEGRGGAGGWRRYRRLEKVQEAG